MRAGFEELTRPAQAATIGKVIFYSGIFTEQEPGPFAGGCEFANTFRAGEDICVRDLACGKSLLQNGNCFVLTENIFE